MGGVDTDYRLYANLTISVPIFIAGALFPVLSSPYTQLDASPREKVEHEIYELEALLHSYLLPFEPSGKASL